MEDLILYLLVSLVGILLGSLICWGLGNVIIFIFKINYTWTFLHGFGLELIYLFLRGLFKQKD